MPTTYPHVSFASWRWMIALVLTASLALLASLSLQGESQLEMPGVGSAATPEPALGTGLAELAAMNPAREVEVIVRAEGSGGDARALVNGAGGRVTRDLRIIGGVGAEMTAAEAAGLAGDPRVYSVSLNAKVESSAEALEGSSLDLPADEQMDKLSTGKLATSFNQSIRADKVWKTGETPVTGRNVAVAVVDTGVDGGNQDFQVSEANPESRVIASAVVNPDATNADDGYGHGTHVTGLIAGNGNTRARRDPLNGRYVGSAPHTNIVSVKVSDDQGETTLIDVIDGLQFVVDHKAQFNIRVVNLSLNSTVAESYRTDPLDAAVEQAWFKGIVVVAAAGNSGDASDAVSYAPANDPYVISVGAVDDLGTKDISDDQLADWSSRGVTQDGFAKPEVIAPGAHIVSTLAKGSEFETLCSTCITEGDYFKMGGTSMAAAIVSGAVADLISAEPQMTPDEVKTAFVSALRPVAGAGAEVDLKRTLNVAQGERDRLIKPANVGLTPNNAIDPATGEIDYERARWSRARWSEATEALRARWSRARWSSFMCICLDETSSVVESEVDPERARWSRARWSRARWSRARWSMSFTK